MQILRRMCFLFALLVGFAALAQLPCVHDLPAEALANSRGAHDVTFGEMPAIDVSQLPQEARDTLILIKQGGPFPYPKDGSAFGNRERRLPIRSRGYYKEYTVKTPGSRDRGARRIIAGAVGEYYYTDDHYSTFKPIRGVLP